MYEVFYTLRDAVLLVALVVLLFLQDWRAMILPMIDVPVSLIGTFAVMALLGFSLNNLTLFGLVLAIGIVVDDAIVVLENIERQIASGLHAREATIKAMDEITGPVVAITLVLAAVFIPCCFLGGISGQFFRQFAVTIAVSTVISAINALTMTPFPRGADLQGRRGSRARAPQGGAALVVLRHRGRRRQLLSCARPRVAGRFGLPAANDASVPAWQWWSLAAIYALPGVVVGGVIGMADHPPGERRAGLVLPRLQPRLQLDYRGLRQDGRRGAAAGGRRDARLRRPAGTDVVAILSHAHRLHSAAGQGLSDPQRAVARIGLAAADREGHGRKSRPPR